jgi:HAD superfamily hydrolase (TIGR01450 family)
MATRDAAARLRLVILDMDGVLYRGSAPIDGVLEFVRRLHGRGLLVRYATNNAMFTREEFARSLGAMGISAAADEIVTSTWATVAHLRRHEPGVRSILAVGAPGLVAELGAAGYEVRPAADSSGPEAVDAVVVGLDPDFDEGRLAVAVRAMRDGARFYATNVDMRYPTPDGFRPGAGAIVEAIQQASGVVPVVIGKPAPAMFDAILESTGMRANEALVIGDNPDSDMVAAHRAGIESVLVLTGVTGADAVVGLRGEQVPDHVRVDVAAAWDLVAARLRD